MLPLGRAMRSLNTFPVKKKNSSKELSDYDIQMMARKIKDKRYIDGAIQRLALILSNQLLDMGIQEYGSGKK